MSSSSIQSKQISSGRTLKKSKYFEKYRNQLNMISSKIKKPNITSSPVWTQKNPFNPSQDSIRMTTSFLPNNSLKFKNMSSNSSEIYSKINTDRSNQNNLKLQYRESIKIAEPSPEKQEQSRVNIHTFTDLSDDKVNNNYQQSSESIRQSLFMEKQSPLHKKIYQLGADEPKMNRANTENQKDSVEYPFTFSNIQAETIERRLFRKNTSGLQDAINAVNFPRPKSKSKTPDSQKNLTRSPNLSPVPSTFNMKSMNFSLKRQNTTELNQSQLRKSFGPINRRKQSDLIIEVQSMVKQFQHLKSKIQKIDIELKQKRNRLETLKEQQQGSTEMDYMKSIVRYAERILQIEQKIKEAKKQHQYQLDQIAMQKKQIHNQNLQLSKAIDTFESQTQALKVQYETLQKQHPSKVLQAKATKIQNQIEKLQHQIQLGEKRKNNSQELQDISQAQFKRFSQAWLKRLLGKQIKQAEERIYLHNPARYQKQIMRKKQQLKEKKIEIQLRKKSVIQCNRVKQNLEKQIKELKVQLQSLNSVERKMSIFNTHTN